MDHNGPVAPPQVNRRSSRRMPPNRLARVECRRGGLGLGPNLLLSILDISETGIRLVLRAPIEAGQEAEVLLQGLGITRPEKRLARVVWVLPLDEGGYCAGLHFDKPLRYVDLQRLARAFQYRGNGRPRCEPHSPPAAPGPGRLRPWPGHRPTSRCASGAAREFRARFHTSHPFTLAGDRLPFGTVTAAAPFATPERSVPGRPGHGFFTDNAAGLAPHPPHWGRRTNAASGPCLCAWRFVARSGSGGGASAGLIAGGRGGLVVAVRNPGPPRGRRAARFFYPFICPAGKIGLWLQ